MNPGVVLNLRALSNDIVTMKMIQNGCLHSVFPLLFAFRDFIVQNKKTIKQVRDPCGFGHFHPLKNASLAA